MWTLVSMEPSLKYHPYLTGALTYSCYPGEEHCLVGSLTGAGASQKVTEASKGPLRLDGNQVASAKAEGGLTVRLTGRADTKVGLSDPVALSGRAIAQRIKGTPGITGLSGPRVHIDDPVWHLDVDSSHPGAEAGPKGWAVRPLKRYESWVQNVVRQFGPYLLQAQGAWEDRSSVRRGRG